MDDAQKPADTAFVPVRWRVDPVVTNEPLTKPTLPQLVWEVLDRDGQVRGAFMLENEAKWFLRANFAKNGTIRKASPTPTTSGVRWTWYVYTYGSYSGRGDLWENNRLVARQITKADADRIIAAMAREERP